MVMTKMRYNTRGFAMSAKLLASCAAESAPRVYLSNVVVEVRTIAEAWYRGDWGNVGVT